MFRFAILFDVKSANKFSAGFSQYPVSKVAATEMAQCVERNFLLVTEQSFGENLACQNLS